MDIIKIEWLEIKDRLKVLVSYLGMERFLPPVVILLREIYRDWQETSWAITRYLRAQEKRYNIQLERQYYPEDMEAPIPPAAKQIEMQVIEASKPESKVLLRIPKQAKRLTIGKWHGAKSRAVGEAAITIKPFQN